MVASQVLASGGIWLEMDGTQIMVDPGPGAIVHATQRKLNPEKLSAIIMSHRHLDHSADANIMVEAMIRGGFRPHGRLLAPSDALNYEPVVYSYLKPLLDSVDLLEAGKSYAINGVTVTTPVRHIHGVETYGMIFRTATHSVAYIADTKFFPELGRAYSGKVLIINALMTNRDWPVDHLSVYDAERLITEIKPEVAIMTHFGMRLWQTGPNKVASEVAAHTGSRVIAARDGMQFDLNRLEVIDA